MTEMMRTEAQKQQKEDCAIEDSADQKVQCFSPESLLVTIHTGKHEGDLDRKG